MRGVVSAEVVNDFGNLTLKFDVERLNNIEPPPIGLPGDNPKYVRNLSIVNVFKRNSTPSFAGGRVLLLAVRASDYLPAMELDTVRRARPLARRRASTLRPSADAMRARKPCLFTRLRLWGWNVLFIITI